MSTLLQQDAAFRRQRRESISKHSTQIGLDYLEVEATAEEEVWRLRLHFVPKANASADPAPALSPANIRFLSATSGLPSPNLQLREPVVSSGTVVEITLRAERAAWGESGGPPTYLLQLINVPNLDPFFDQVAFQLRRDATAGFDPRALPTTRRAPLPAPEIDYLARDYASFRTLLLNRLALLLPDWQERNPADLQVALVELLAYSADRLSYYQDAVATEAYLGTARRRVSLRRHARLLDYAVHEGCNARVWVAFEVDEQEKELPAGTKLLTGAGTGQSGAVFETMSKARLHAEHNQLHFYTWGAREFTLPAGATQATLRGAYRNLREGDVLIFAEVRGPASGQPGDADQEHRHAVRLTAVEPGNDPVGEQVNNAPPQITTITWHTQDALPFELPIATYNGVEYFSAVSVARGNVVLADHGRTETEEAARRPEDALLQPAVVPDQGVYRPRLAWPDLTFAAPFDADAARQRPAALALQQDPASALPVITLREAGGTKWSPRPDLLASGRFDYHFVVETEADGYAYLRFGDGVHGRRPAPGTVFSATYRVGNGPAGNLGREAITILENELESKAEQKKKTIVRNPLPASGGLAPEPIEQVRLYAPAAFKVQQRCVTAADYVVAAERHPEVQRAAATVRWTGSRHSVIVAVDRLGEQPCDAAFQEELRAYLERFRIAGYSVQVRPPQYVALDIALGVQPAPGHFTSTVRQALLERFSNADLPGGAQGYFHPDNFSFGQPVYLSRIVAAAMQVPGVAWIFSGTQPAPESSFLQPARFEHLGQPAAGALDSGQIVIEPLAIARLDNDPYAPERGRIGFFFPGESGV